ncbi:MoxR family ATPase [Clostridium sp.]|uniref:AAA family ATPase n=1 Tax=Clostridium sp. TaxID=1506 RepID=UPI002844E62F|nr:MoxR family ATPase [Clostridium sp.]MDR3593592.1 MoxR family ATPase [Clostridium sp.]
MNIKTLSENIKTNIQKVIIGKDNVIDIVITALISGGHVLLEDVPGTGKTVLARSLAKSVDSEFKRVQFTPDLMPSDLTGINYYNQKLGEFTLRKGPVFTNILLADEINRATPRTQSSLLECMEEKQVSIDGTTYILDKPFFVIASQNPVESQGTFPLPEAQLDRFLIKINMGQPSLEEGKQIFKRFIEDNPLEELQSICTKEDIIEAREISKKIFVSDDVQEYILKIVEETLNNENIVLGISPRGSLAMLKACQVYAAINGRTFVNPDDVKALAPCVFAHRLIIKNSLRVKGISSEDVIKGVLNKVQVPTEVWNK